MLREVAAKRPRARIEGFTVEPMAERAKAHEIILGMSIDPTFGPVLMVGAGGVAVEALGDRAIGFPPLNPVLAREMIARTRIAKLLKGYRDVPPADEAALATALVKLSELVVAHPEIGEIDINPLLVSAEGVVALDARIILRPPSAMAQGLAITPYPADLEREETLRSGERIHLRPIRPEDEPALVAMVDASTPQDRAFRFHHEVKQLSHAMAARFSQIDYDREMAIIALGQDGAIWGVARLVSDPNYESAEFAVMVRSDKKGLGIGYLLMQELIAYAQSRGIERLFALVLKNNATMLDLARELGATIEPESGTAVRVIFQLESKAGEPAVPRPGIQAKWPPPDLSQIIV
jgi:acetyltransferase